VISFPLGRKEQIGFFNALEELKHVHHEELTNTGTINVEEYGLVLSYRLVVEITATSNPQGISEEKIREGLLESLRSL
jgi:hypothetical protein